MVLILFFACLLVTGNDMSTFTRLHKDNTMQSGDGQRQAGKDTKKRSKRVQEEEEESKGKQRRVDELIIAKDFRLDSFFVSTTTTDKARTSMRMKTKTTRDYC
jgi:hypothetical protein